MDAYALTTAERSLLEALTRRGQRFIVVGLIAAVVQGAPVTTQDIDLWLESPADESVRDAELHAQRAHRRVAHDLPQDRGPNPASLPRIVPPPRALDMATHGQAVQLKEESFIGLRCRPQAVLHRRRRRHEDARRASIVRVITNAIRATTKKISRTGIPWSGRQ